MRNFALRRAATIGIALVGVTATAAVTGAQFLPIEPLLPTAGQTVCFTADLDGSRELVYGWRHEKIQERAPVVTMSIRIERPAEQEPNWDRGHHTGFDRQYTAQVGLRVAGKPGWYATPTTCNWEDHPINLLAPDIYCYIDCDGGGVTIIRAAGRRALDVVWEAHSHLRMSHCGGGGVILRAGNTTKTFRVHAAPIEKCPALHREGP